MSGPALCDLCSAEVERVHIGSDVSGTVLCSTCAGRQPLPEDVLGEEDGAFPCLDGCRVGGEEEACDHGSPTWAVWLGWV